MSRQILKIIIDILLVLALTMTNFVFVSSSLISYAADNDSTNQSNIKFSSYFKDENGNKVTTKESKYNQTEEYLYLQIEVQKEGYLLGSIALEEGANFKLVSSESEYVEKIEENTISLHNITSGGAVEIAVKIEPINEAKFDIGLLEVESKITLKGTYKDSTEKDKTVEATKKVSLKYADEINKESVVNEIKPITNKILKVNGEEKRVVQLLWNIGLKENSYPIEEISTKINTPEIGENAPEVETKINLNTMTASETKNENNTNEVTLKNEAGEDGKVTWKKEGVESIILTYIYNKDTQIQGLNLNGEIKIKLYDGKELTGTIGMTLSGEEQDSVIEVATKNQEGEIYKGKLEAGVERSYITRTSVTVNLSNVVENIKIQENASTYTVNETENAANIYYSRTMIKKEQFDKILGENGKITITNGSGEILGTIDAKTEANQVGYLSLEYKAGEVKKIKIETTKPVAEGTLEINHVKTAKESQKEIVKQATNIKNTIIYNYNQGENKQIENTINLKNSVTQSKLTIDKEQLSTVIENNVQMRVTLLTNDEKYDLYEKPRFVIELPEKVENIEIININKMYDENGELGEPTYEVEGRTIKVALEGKQKTYTPNSLEGIVLVINAKIRVNKTAATSDEQIRMVYQNENAVSYENGENVGKASTNIKVIAVKDEETNNTNGNTNDNTNQTTLQAGEETKLTLEIIPIVGENQLSENDTVKTGEVIKYKINITNNGTKEATNIKVIGEIPNGTTAVEPMENFEYTGAAYYQETDKTQYEKIIEKLEVGKNVELQYEVRVNTKTEAGTKITNNVKINYGKLQAESKITNIVETANIRASIKRVSDMDQDFYQGSQVNYYVIVENISNEKQENVVVTNNFSDNVDIRKVELITGMGIWEENGIEETDPDFDIEEDYEEGEIIREPENTTSEEIQYSEQINIGTLDIDEIKVLRYTGFINDGKKDKLTFYATVTDKNNIQSRTNLWEDVVETFEIELKMTTNTKSKYVKAEDKIEYVIEVKNTGKSNSGTLLIEDSIPTHLTIENVLIDDQELVSEFVNNNIVATVKVDPGKSVIIKIETTVQESLGRTEPEVITNYATTEIAGEKIKSNEITHIIEKTTLPSSGEGTEGENAGQDDNEQGNNNVANGNRIISGTAWLDKNKDGKKEDGESLLAGITVKLLNAENNQLVRDIEGNVLQTKTSGNGLYMLENIEAGKYIVIFEYDETKYGITQYKASGASNSENSSVIINNLNIDGKTETKASTDIITVGDSSIENINIGLIQLQNYDLQLNKYVSKIIIENNTGTTVKQYDNSKLAKIEIDGKKINGSKVSIEYSIVISNVGEVDGYARQIVDYMPNNLEFDVQQNKDWYLENGKLYNNSIADDKIPAGQSRTLTLILNKTMTEENTGRIINTAEIAEDYNELGIEDSNSIPGNRLTGENDTDYADVIISIKTGAVIYISILSAILAIGIIIAIIIYKKRKVI